MADTAQRCRAPSPVSRNPAYMHGPLVAYEATDAELMAAGLIEVADIPGPSPGCKNPVRRQVVGVEYIRTYRMADGRVRLTISENLVRQRDTAFVTFLASINSPVLSAIQEAARA